MKRLMSYLLLLVAVLGVAGCNVFDGLGEGRDSDNPAVLLTDGARALERGQADTAVRLLRRAVARTSERTYEGRIARLKLASALLMQQRVGILLAQDVANDLVAALDRAPFTPLDSLPAPSCTTGSARQAVGPLGVMSVEGYAQLHAARPVLDSVRILMQFTLGTSLPGSPEQIQGGLASLVAQGADAATLSEVLVNTALVQLGIGYDNLVAAGADNQVRWIAARETASGTGVAGACAPSLAFLNTFLLNARSALDFVGSSAELARLRAGYFSEGSAAQMLAIDLGEFYDRLTRGLFGAP